MNANLAKANEITCPDRLENHPWSDASLFYGPPSLRADMEPDDEGWQFGPGPRDPDRYLVCRYQDDVKTIVLLVPRAARQCLFGRGPTATVSCR